MKRLSREAAQAVVASGHRAPLKGDVVEDLAEGDGDHGEVNAAPAGDKRAEQRPGNAAEERAADERQRRARGEKLERESRPVSAQPEPRGVAEREHTRE